MPSATYQAQRPDQHSWLLQEKAQQAEAAHEETDAQRHSRPRPWTDATEGGDVINPKRPRTSTAPTALDYLAAGNVSAAEGAVLQAHNEAGDKWESDCTEARRSFEIHSESVSNNQVDRARGSTAEETAAADGQSVEDVAIPITSSVPSIPTARLSTEFSNPAKLTLSSVAHISHVLEEDSGGVPNHSCVSSAEFCWQDLEEDSRDTQSVIHTLSDSGGDPSRVVLRGQNAARSMVLRVEAQYRSQWYKEFKHGSRKRNEQLSNTLASRRLENDFPHHGGPGLYYGKKNKPPKQKLHRSDQEGEDFGLLFDTILCHLDMGGFIAAMLDRAGTIPQVATDRFEFHSQNWRQFGEFVEQSGYTWISSSKYTKHKAVADWLFIKFTLDPCQKVMLPEDVTMRSKRNEICWRGFEMNDKQLESLVQQVMAAYFVNSWLPDVG